MKKVSTRKNKNGKVDVGIYTKSTMPNHKKKRKNDDIYKGYYTSSNEHKNKDTMKIKIRVNWIGFLSALAILICLPIVLPWKIAFAISWIILSIEIEIKEEK